MEKFKVGDKVVCIKDVGILKKGQVYTVRHPYEGDRLVGFYGEFIYLDGDTRQWGGYCSAGFKLYKPELTEAQSAGVAGGIQQHSIGDTYPLAAVMYEHNGKKCIAIEDLQTGEVAAVGNHVTNWETFEYAYHNIELIANGGRWFKTKGRVMNIGGSWVVAEPANPVRVTRLHNMLHRGQDTDSSGS